MYHNTQCTHASNVLFHLLQNVIDFKPMFERKHVLNKQELDLEPWYKIFHEELLKKIKAINRKVKYDKTPDENTSSKTGNSKDILYEPSSSASNDDTKDAVLIESTLGLRKTLSEDEQAKQDANDKPRLQQTQSSGNLNIMNIESNKMIPNFREYTLNQNGAFGDIIPTTAHDKKQQMGVAGSSNTTDHMPLSTIDLPNAVVSNFNRIPQQVNKNVCVIQPFLRQTSDDESSPKFVKSPIGPELKSNTTTRSISLPVPKIVLLRMHHIHDTCVNCKVEYRLDRKQIEIKGNPNDCDLFIVKVQSKLDEIKESNKHISDFITGYLRRKPKLYDFFRDCLLPQDIKAYISLEASKNELKAIAFSHVDANRGLDTVLCIFDQKEISYSEQHFSFLGSPAFTKMKTSVENKGTVSVTVMKQQKKIVIEGEKETLKKTSKEIEDELSKHARIKAKPIKFEGGMAKMIFYCMFSDLKKIQNNIR